jgi:hypothetical protein
MSGQVEKRGGGGLKLVDGVALVVVGVIGVVVAFWILGAIAGFLWGLVKVVVLVAIVVGVVYLLVGRRRRTS